MPDTNKLEKHLKTAIEKIEHAEVAPKIILSNIGVITETDVTLASASNAVLIGFNVRPNKEAKKLAEIHKITIKLFNIIYEVLDFVSDSFIIECKGRANESFPMRWKLFERMINIKQPYVTLYKPQNQKECDQVIELIIKNK